jgi:hypothetical protein
VCARQAHELASLLNVIPAWSLAEVRRDLEQRFERDGFEADAVVMIGFLFARPQAALARGEIIPDLPYFHHRAGRHIHFFCVGYGAYWPPGSVPDAEKVLTIDGTDWLYSDRLFNEFRAELERTTAWHYSGGTDLLLTNATWDAAHRSADLDFSTALSMNLEQAIADEAIPGVGRWFERIFRFAENSHDGNDPTWGFSSNAGLVAARSGLVSAVLSFLPGRFGAEAQKLPHFLVADLAR